MEKCNLQFDQVPWHLRFTPDKEARFREYFYETNIGFLRMSFLAITVVSVLFNVFSFSVVKFTSDQVMYLVMLLLLTATPVFGLVMTYSKWFKQLYHTLLTFLITTTTAAVILAILSLPPLLKPTSYGAILFILLVNFGLLRQRFLSAAINGLIVTSLFTATAVSMNLLERHVLLQLISYFLLFNLGGGAVAYLFDWSQRKAFLAKELIEAEHERAENLLLNILPMPIADRLKSSQSCIADRVEEVSVLFADIVGFTERAKTINPEKLVDLLNSLFSDFDTIMEKHGVEKIKTIGDSYMAAAGLLDSGTDHCARLAEAALDIMELVKDLQNGITLRIGLHRGPVVAGVIGRKKMIYDLWGDTVNIASRMESHGESGAIQVSEAVYLVLRDRFTFSEPRTISVKGQGQMRVAFLTGRSVSRLAA